MSAISRHLVVMAAGFGVTKEPGTDRFASQFQAAGYSVTDDLSAVRHEPFVRQIRFPPANSAGGSRSDHRAGPGESRPRCFRDP